VLIITDDNKNVVLSCKNINYVEAKNWNQVSTKDILNASAVIIEQSAVSKIGAIVSKNEGGEA
jgi:ribosomal protein L4